MHSDPGRSALIWRSLTLRLLLAAFPLWCTTAMLTHPTWWRIKIAVGTITLLTLVTPAGGLLAVAALTPAGMAIGMLLKALPYRMTETFVMGFLAAWLLRAGADRFGPRVPAVMAAAGRPARVASR